MIVQLLRRLAAGTAAVFLASSAGVNADEVTIGGVTHKDVLVYKGASVYYIKIPKDGRVINIPAKELDASSVKISEDPYERDQLKAKFEDMKVKREEAIREAGGTLPADSPFNTAIEGGSESFDTASLLGKRGGGKGLGIPRAVLVQGFQGAGFQFGAASASGVTGTSPDGKMTIELQGPESGITGMVMTLPTAMAQIVLGGMAQNMGQMIPWIPEFLASARQDVMQGKAAERSQDGIFVSIVPQGAGPGGSLVFTIRGA